MKKTLIVLALASAFFLQGCATIMKGQTKTINISSSDNQSVNAKLNSATGTQDIVLPTTVTVMKKKANLTITVTDPEYQSTTVTKEPTMEPWFIGNIIIGGIFGSTTDAATGAMWTYDDQIEVPVVKE